MPPDPTFKSSPGRHEWPKGTTPVLFRGLPTHYQIVTPEYLAEWESLLKEILGVDAQVSAGMQTTSFCGRKPDGHPNPCDCDVI
jgi:hypothetical protein